MKDQKLKFVRHLFKEMNIKLEHEKVYFNYPNLYDYYHESYLNGNETLSQARADMTKYIADLFDKVISKNIKNNKNIQKMNCNGYDILFYGKKVELKLSVFVNNNESKKNSFTGNKYQNKNDCDEMWLIGYGIDEHTNIINKFCLFIIDKNKGSKIWESIERASKKAMEYEKSAYLTLSIPVDGYQNVDCLAGQLEPKKKFCGILLESL